MLRLLASIALCVTAFLPQNWSSPDWDCRRTVSHGVDWNTMRVALRSRLATLRKRRGKIREVLIMDCEAEPQMCASWVQWMINGADGLGFKACPIGFVTITSITHAIAHGANQWVVGEELRQRIEGGVEQALVTNLETLLSTLPIWMAAASEWDLFGWLDVLSELGDWPDLPFLTPKHKPLWGAESGELAEFRDELLCRGQSVKMFRTEYIMAKLRSLSGYAATEEGSITSMVFLNGIDPLVFALLDGESNFMSQYVQECPVGGFAIAAASQIVALMASPKLFSHFANLGEHLSERAMLNIVSGAPAWKIWHLLSALGTFKLRPYDAVMGSHDWYALPDTPAAFDAQTRAEYRRAWASASDARTAALGGWLDASEECELHSSATESRCYVVLSAVGGQKWAPHIYSWLGQSRSRGLKRIVLACMDAAAQEACEVAVDRGGWSREVYCLSSSEGHLIYSKYRWLPTVLSAGYDAFWVDFDVYVHRSPFPALDAAFSNSTIDIATNEHWNALCINNGIFYLKRSARALFWAWALQKWVADVIYADNQNGFDAFLAHTQTDAFVPTVVDDDSWMRPLKSNLLNPTAIARIPRLHYALLDVEREFPMAEGHDGTEDDLVMFHFWMSDYAPAAGAPKNKWGWFKTMFGFNRTERSAAYAAIRGERPGNRTACSVMTVGLSDLIKERFPNIDEKALVPDHHRLRAEGEVSAECAEIEDFECIRTAVGLAAKEAYHE